MIPPLIHIITRCSQSNKPSMGENGVTITQRQVPFIFIHTQTTSSHGTSVHSKSEFSAVTVNIQDQEQSRMKSELVRWVKKSGKDKGKGKHNADHSVYPLSMTYSAKEKCWMRLQRIILLLIIVLVLIPYDTIVGEILPNPYFRWYWASKITNLNLNIAQVSTLTMDIQGCSVELRSNSDKDRISFKVSSDYNTNPSISGTTLKVDHGSNDEHYAIKCLISVYLPIATTGVVIPNVSITPKGDSHSKLRIEDKLGSGEYFNFGSNTLQISGTLMNVYLHNPHVMGVLSISLDRGHVLIETAAPTTSASVYTKVGSIDFRTSKDVVALTQVVESNGQVCIQGAAVNSVTATNCPSTATRATVIPYNSGVVSTSAQCSVTGTLCSNTTCSAASSFSLTAKSDDGAVAVQNSASSAAEVNYMRSHIESSVYSQSVLNEFKTLITNNPNEDFVLIIDVFMPGHHSVWIYSTQKSYIIGRAWALSFVSAGLLKPVVKRVKIYMGDSTCTVRDSSSVYFNYDISTELKTYLTIDEKSILVHYESENTYYEYLNEQNYIPERKLITIDYENGTFIAAYTISGFIALYGAIQFMVLIFKGYHEANKRFTLFLEKQRHYVTTKVMYDTKEEKEVETTTIGSGKVMQLGLFTHKVYFRENTEKKKKKGGELQGYGFFNLLYLGLETYRRRNVNSLVQFLEQTPVSQTQFPRTYYQSESHRYRTTIKLNQFENKYKQFCITQGYIPLILEEQKENLAMYGLKMKKVMDKHTMAYTKIRWRADFNIEEVMAHVDENVISADNSVSLFLKEECEPSNFESDYIPVKDLQKNYSEYCKMNGIPKHKIEKIVGSIEMDKFGADLDENFAIQVLENIKVDMNDSHKLVRIDQNVAKNARHKRRLWLKKQFKRVNRAMWNVDGPMTCLIQVLVNYITILVIIIPMNIIVLFLYGERSQFNEDVYSSYHDPENLYQPDQSNYYGSQISLYEVVIAVHAYSGFFYVIALLELLSYFSVGFINVGKYPVKKTMLKTVVRGLFWICLFINLFLYSMYILIFLVWFVLGAIINPNKFLPYASASITLISFIYYSRKRLKKFQNMLKRELSEIVKQKMVFFLRKTLEKLGGVTSYNEISNQLAGQVQNSSREIYVKQVLGTLGKSIQEIDNDLLQRLLKGEQKAYEELILLSLGIHEGLSRALFSTYSNDKDAFLDSIVTLANELNLDPDLSRAIANVILSTQNVSKDSEDYIGGMRVAAFKKLLRIIFPDIHLEIVDSILPFITEGKPKKLMEVLNTFNRDSKEVLPLALGELLRVFILEENTKIHKSIEFLGKQLFRHNTEVHEIFQAHLDLMIGKVNEGVDILAPKLHIDHKYLLKSICLLGNHDQFYTRHNMKDILDEIVMDLRFFDEEDGIGNNSTHSRDSMNLDDLEKEVGLEGGMEELEQQIYHNSKASEEHFHLVTAAMEVFEGFEFNIGRVSTKLGINANTTYLSAIQEASQYSKNSLNMLFVQLKIYKNRDVIESLFKYKNRIPTAMVALRELIGIQPNQISTFKAAIMMVELGLIVSDSLMGYTHKLSKSEAYSYSKIYGKIMYTFFKHKIIEAPPHIRITYTKFGVDKYSQKAIKKYFLKQFKDKITHTKINENNELDGGIGPIIELINEGLAKEFSAKSINAIKAIGIALYAPVDSTDPQFDVTFHKATDFIAELTEQKSNDIALLFDILSQDPKRLFQSEEKTEQVVDLDHVQMSKYSFDDDRMHQLKKLCGIKQKHLEKIATEWIESSDLLNHAKRYVPKLSKEIFGVPVQFVKFLEQFNTSNPNLTQHELKLQQQEALQGIFTYVIDHYDDFHGLPAFHHDQLNEILEKKFPFDPKLESDNFREYETIPEEKQLQFREKMFKVIDLAIDVIEKDSRIADIFNMRYEHLINLLKEYFNTEHPHIILEIILYLATKTTSGFGRDHSYEKYEFAQIAILFNAKYLENDSDWLEQSKQNHKILKMANQYFVSDDDKLKNCHFRKDEHMCKSLFEGEYFNNIANVLIKKPIQKLLGSQVCIKKPEAIVGIMLAKTLDDRQLLKTSIIHFLSDIIQTKKLRGILGLLLNDLEEQSFIIHLAKRAGVDTNLLISTIDIMSPKPKKVTHDLEVIIPDTFEDVDGIGAFISLFKKDFSKLRFIVEKIKLDLNKIPDVRMVLNLAVGNLNEVVPYYDMIAKKLQFECPSIVDSALSLLNGDRVKIKDIGQPEIVDAFVALTHHGIAMREGKAVPDKVAHQHTMAVKSINSLMTQFRINYKTYQIQKYKIKNKPIVLDLPNFLILLTGCVWGNKTQQDMLANELIQITFVDDNESIWKRFEDDRSFILQRKLKDVCRQGLVADQKFGEIRLKWISEFKEVHEPKLEELNEGDDNAELLKEIGCTVKYSGKKKLEQIGFICTTCNDTTSTVHQVCQVCALTCHKGHKVQAKNLGLKHMFTCKCGLIPHKETEHGVCQYKFGEIRQQYLKQVKDEVKQHVKDVKKHYEDKNTEIHSALAEYSNDHFIRDLNKVFPLKNEYIKSDLLQQNKMAIEDNREGETFQFYDNWIQLANGNVRYSFINLFASFQRYCADVDKADNPAMKDKSMDDFRELAGIIAFIKGDHVNLEIYGRYLNKLIGLNGNEEMTANNKLMCLHTLVNSSRIHKDPPHDEHYTQVPHNLYKYTMKKLFPSKFNEIMLFHKIITLSNKKFLHLLKMTTESLESEWDPQMKDLFLLFDKFFLKKIANYEKGVLESFKQVLRVSLGDQSAIPQCQFDKRKIIRHGTNKELSKQFIEILDNGCNKHQKELITLIMVGMLLNKKGLNTDHSHVTKYIGSKKFMKASMYLFNLFNIINGKSINVSSDVKFVFKKAKLSKHHRQGVLLIKGILLQIPQFVMKFWNNKGNNEDRLINQTIISYIMRRFSKGTTKDFISIIKHHFEEDIRKDQVFSNWLDHKETRNLIHHLIQSFQGRFDTVGQCLDQIIFQNKQCVFTLLINLTMDDGWAVTIHDNEDNKKNYVTLVQKELYRIFSLMFLANPRLQNGYDFTEENAIPLHDQEFEHLNLSQEQLVEFVEKTYEFRIPEIFMSMLSMEKDMIGMVFPKSDVFQFADKDLIKFIFNFAAGKNPQESMKGIIEHLPGMHGHYQAVIKKFGDHLNLDMDDLKDIGQAAKIDYSEGITDEFKRILGFEEDDQQIKVNLIELMTLMFMAGDMQQHIMIMLVQALQPLYKNIPLLPQVFKAFILLVEGRVVESLKYVPQIILLVIVSFRWKDDLTDEERKNLMQEKDWSLVEALMKWMQLSETDLELLQEMLELGVSYQEKIGVDSKLVQKKEKLGQISEMIMGIIYLSRKEFGHLQFLASQLGDYDPKKFYKLLNKIVKYGQVFAKEVVDVDRDKIQSVVKQMMNDALDEAFDVSELFAIFDRDRDGQLDFKEFLEIDKYLGLNLGEQFMLQLFAKADRDHDNMINYEEFVNSQLELRYYIAMRALEKVGLTMSDLVYWFVQSLIMLLLLLGFIFVGIIAMSSYGTFTSIINSFLPIAAGLGSASRQQDISESIKKVKEAVTTIIHSMRNTI